MPLNNITLNGRLMDIFFSKSNFQDTFLAFPGMMPVPVAMLQPRKNAKQPTSSGKRKSGPQTNTRIASVGEHSGKGRKPTPAERALFLANQAQDNLVPSHVISEGGCNETLLVSTARSTDVSVKRSLHF
jgi:hypothetical protein